MLTQPHVVGEFQAPPVATTTLHARKARQQDTEAAHYIGEPK